MRHILFLQFFVLVVAVGCNMELEKKKLNESEKRVEEGAKREKRNYGYVNTGGDDDLYIFDSLETEESKPPLWLNEFITRPITTSPRPVIPNAGSARLPPCEENCNTKTTSQYNPVCATNGDTYDNASKLACAIFCGKNIRLRRHGRCFPLLPTL